MDQPEGPVPPAAVREDSGVAVRARGLAPMSARCPTTGAFRSTLRQKSPISGRASAPLLSSLFSPPCSPSDLYLSSTSFHFLCPCYSLILPICLLFSVCPPFPTTNALDNRFN